MDEKTNLRATKLAQRDALSKQTRARKSANVCAKVTALTVEALQRPFAATREGREPRVAVYAAMRSEVDLQLFVEDVFSRGWIPCFPCMVRDEPGAESRMALYLVPPDRYDSAREDFLNSPLRCLIRRELAEKGYEEADPSELDAVVVPLVAFDDAGNRLGYGGGNYDRLLPCLRDDALIVGVAFDEQRADAVPCEPHDRPLPHIVSA
ncbi:5-formyltetrahydrofolate cyclo-ligase [Gordonibacter sp. 28C]|uniref:5-formyltetrahydrofolate cyclo-ligase n=1 Tax=Gordonibacter sp. 28C TaxID=2078569 RepID=UPI000DF82A11|nr:5-formyltetrahydrofolate cyclo-ligase [Gordonibacter sp. 28C]RDB59703.1 5-formyltetrahydrofolate cyclo-ligase [Gordonibacter sp. 28C]